LKKLIKKS